MPPRPASRQGNTFVQTFARLRPGVSIEQLDAELGTVMKASIAENPKFLTDWSSFALRIREAQFRLQRPGLLALAGGVVALLLIACANLGNLMLAQFVSRRSQLSLRAALGGGSAALLRLQVIRNPVAGYGGCDRRHRDRAIDAADSAGARSLSGDHARRCPYRLARAAHGGPGRRHRRDFSQDWSRSYASFAATCSAGLPRAIVALPGRLGIGGCARSSSAPSARSPWCCSRAPLCC